MWSTRHAKRVLYEEQQDDHELPADIIALGWGFRFDRRRRCPRTLGLTTATRLSAPFEIALSVIVETERLRVIHLVLVEHRNTNTMKLKLGSVGMGLF